MAVQREYSINPEPGRTVEEQIQARALQKLHMDLTGPGGFSESQGLALVSMTKFILAHTGERLDGIDARLEAIDGKLDLLIARE